MSKNKHQNHYGTFAVKTKGIRKHSSKLIMALTVMIFVLGGGLAVYKKINKPNKVSQTQTTESAFGIPGYWYQKYFGSSVCEKDSCNPQADPDSDKLTNAQEYFYHTDPLNDHTIGDEMNDGELVAAGFDPSRVGHMTFDEVVSDDNILGESLLLDADIKKLVAEDLDIDNVVLPLVEDDELEIIYEESESVYNRYSEDMTKAVDKYFPSQRMDSIMEIFQTGDDFALADARRKSELLSAELKKVPVPKKLLLFHKYQIALCQLISDVTNPAAQGSDAWFDKVQALLATQQRLSLEQQKLNKGL